MTAYLTSVILNAAKAASIPGWLLLAVCTNESNLNPNAIHHDDGGSNSIGLCQIKKDTASDMGFKGTESDLLNPHLNAKYSALYLKTRLNKYNNYCKAVAAYNSGSFMESKEYPRIPRNIKYVRKVQYFVNQDKKHLLECM